MLKHEADLIRFLRSDSWLMEMLEAVESESLPDAWVGAGVIRRLVSDRQTGRHTTERLDDVDVVCFDASDVSEEWEKAAERRLWLRLPQVPWSVKNQARMHHKNGLPPFRSTLDGVASFPETCTAVAVRLERGQLRLAAPYGVEALLNMTITPTPLYRSGEKHHIYRTRLREKSWKSEWPEVRE
ncbi:nucleotidyltransferase family protein [Alkalicoccus luteus]|uniref:Nucleotidyltransferase family protein n=1 Tax=Alkalicoccus luteus TaxID=1237094 RepID=A0A969TUB2_9BACI|nr:nucleotidyltransferase family protein [Alkalicoccus luteus]NJP36877.1 nucleotidyltransferase family protein [Alkalicoccus luteus]